MNENEGFFSAVMLVAGILIRYLERASDRRRRRRDYNRAYNPYDERYTPIDFENDHIIEKEETEERK